MLPHQSFKKTDIRHSLTHFAKTIFKGMSFPIRHEFPFFVLFFLLITLSTFKYFIAGVMGLDLDPIVFKDFARGLSTSYIFTAIISCTGKQWLKIVFYAIGLSLFGLNVFWSSISSYSRKSSHLLEKPTAGRQRNSYPPICFPGTALSQL